MEKRIFTSKATEAAFLLGGIGTGNVAIGSRGELRDWEIFNSPAKGQMLPNSSFCIWTKQEGEISPIAKVLEAQLQPPHSSPLGYHHNYWAGLPRMESSEMIGEFPTAYVTFYDKHLPVQVSLEAYTPFIPLNEQDSSLPCAVLTYNVHNPTEQAIDVTIAGSLINPIGGMTYDNFGGYSLRDHSQNTIKFIRDSNFSGLFYESKTFSSSDCNYGNLALTTINEQTTYRTNWLRGPWADELEEFWADFKSDGRFADGGDDPLPFGDKTDTGSLGIYETIGPGKTETFTFILSWYFPNRMNGWDDKSRVRNPGSETIRNHYATIFRHAWDVAGYFVQQSERLRRESSLFQQALFNSSLPSYVVDALAANIFVLRSTTCFRLEDGTFLGYEGCFNHAGSCPGNCTHVWNYAQTLAFLFPGLERNMRKTEFLQEIDGKGRMAFRAYSMFDAKHTFDSGELAPPAADGQLGSIMRVYREWKLSGDDDFLREIWSNVKLASTFIYDHWDLDGDDILDGKQHVTYDINFYGPNPLTGVLALGALRAMAEMASYLGEEDLAKVYHQRFENSSKRLDQLLWNGSYYEQRLDDVNEHRYQHGKGCLSDQLLGQQLAHLYGLGYLLPQEHVKKAIYSVFTNNFLTDFSLHENCQRTYVLNDEQGLLLCTWPAGGRPKLPFIYSDEVWTGVEYHVAVHLIYEGFLKEGLTLVEAVRRRHDGVRRNPWNEVECGHHYARAMSSWGLLIALSGFQFDLINQTISFDPVINEDNFSCFWSTGKAWGVYSQIKDNVSGDYSMNVQVLYGDLSGVTVTACGQTIIL